MGSIRKSKNGYGYEASVSVAGSRKSRSSANKAQAKIWIAATESDIRQQNSGDIIRIKFTDVLDRYMKEVSTTKKSEKNEVVRILALKRNVLAKLYADDIKRVDIANFRDTRLKKVKSSSVNRDLNLISAIFTKCKNDWGYIHENPVKGVHRPKNPPHRDRLISDKEIEKLRLALGYSNEIKAKKHLVYLYFKLGMLTAMRASELISVTKDSFFDKYVTLHNTKNGTKRDVPLSKEAWVIKRYLT